MNKILLILMAVTVLATNASHAQVPHTLSYQGVVADTSAAPISDGSYNFTFRLYDASSGGSQLWSETQSAMVKRGLFSAILGSTNPIPDSVRFDQQYWLGVQVASDPELSPRMKLASVGSSINSVHAEIAQSVPDNSITETKLQSGQVVKSINNLHDHLTMRGANGASVTASGDTITITASGGGGGGIGTIQNTDNSLSITNPSGPTATINLRSPFLINSTVGIGTTSPTSRLDVNGGSGTGANVGIHGSSNDNYGMYGTSNSSYGVFGESAGSFGVYARTYNPASYAFLAGNNTSNNNYCGLASGNYAVYANGPSFFNGTMGIGVTVPASKLDVSGGSGSGASIGIHGSSNDNYGIYGSSNSSFGVFGESGSSPGIRARTYNPSSYALFADYSTSSTNFCGLSSGDYAMFADGPISVTGASYLNQLFVDGNTTSYISGSLHITGDLSVNGSKDFRIDHPLDPANKTLTHSCIESNERLLMYSGTVVTDGNGDATIGLPSYFEALNINYRYQLTVVGEEFAQARVSRKINNNRFSIKTDKPNIEICWEVTGDRNDAYSKAHPLVVEEEKKPEDRGKYYSPELFGQPKEMRIGYRPPPTRPSIGTPSKSIDN
jgi:hypothetical protein